MVRTLVFVVVIASFGIACGGGSNETDGGTTHDGGATDGGGASRDGGSDGGSGGLALGTLCLITPGGSERCAAAGEILASREVRSGNIIVTIVYNPAKQPTVLGEYEKDRYYSADAVNVSGSMPEGASLPHTDRAASGSFTVLGHCVASSSDCSHTASTDEACPALPQTLSMTLTAVSPDEASGTFAGQVSWKTGEFYLFGALQPIYCRCQSGCSSGPTVTPTYLTNSSGTAVSGRFRVAF